MRVLVVFAICVALAFAHDQEEVELVNGEVFLSNTIPDTNGVFHPLTGCTPSSGSCQLDGSSNYVSRNLTYSTTTGIFTGTITGNSCPKFAYDHYSDGTVGTHMSASAVCFTQTFPAYTGPVAAPLRGAVGYSIAGAVNIYGPFDAGFAYGFACSGSCSAGTDVVVCETSLEYQCGSSLNKQLFLDTCGGHANPYHHHADLACDYTVSAAGHSALVGVALDGRGIYGLYESTGTAPTNLDSCGGHYGPVPSYTTSDGVTYPAATNVYHYHTQSSAPYTLGCFGPVTSNAQCQSLYTSTCGTGFETVYTTGGCYKNYDLDCPCFSFNGTGVYNQPISGLTYSQCVSAGYATFPSVLITLFAIAAFLVLSSHI